MGNELGAIIGVHVKSLGDLEGKDGCVRQHRASEGIYFFSRTEITRGNGMDARRPAVKRQDFRGFVEVEQGEFRGGVFGGLGNGRRGFLSQGRDLTPDLD
eukprot:CAMPEP_0201489694 /NCGR_PEP_ID=MMETSP0151_2-20130828/23351_1 /ASSEMBLY_ACC=CAM_ASM_000257 /TAXON_ID=200890 /ORGANISM="Paramoeba atlantica, Strain 621/1 / CCAP 1560/9" /LENGTH=99 /DNA_ID=CAMNT_0047875373 /DNA_START=1006 /DNA_END=1305 /DNA_ORIENTATION=+